jgi:hypothetical protein
MKKTSQIHISTPCHENWEAMNPAEKGKFCQSCQKTVYDFTDKSDKEILQAFQQNSGKMCGRFTANQLNRPLQIPHKTSFWQRTALLLGFFTLSQFKDAIAKPKPIFNFNYTELPKNRSLNIKKAHFPQKITGKVYDVESKTLIPGVSVYIKNTTNYTITDINGYFELSTNGRDSDLPLIIVFQTVGFEKKEIALSNMPVDAINLTINVSLKTEVNSIVLSGIVGGACLDHSQPPSITQSLIWKVKNWIRSLFN